MLCVSNRVTRVSTIAHCQNAFCSLRETLMTLQVV